MSPQSASKPDLSLTNTQVKTPFRITLLQLFLLLAILCLIYATVYLSLQIQNLRKSPSTPIPAPTPLTQILLPTHTAADPNINPSSTPSPSVTVKPVMTLTYSLPSSWQLVTDKTDTYGVGYNPNTQTGSINSNLANTDALAITNKNLENNPYYSPYANSVYFSLSPYNGGSRHSFIESNVIEEKLSQHTYQEKEYLIQNKRCLVLYNLSDMSQGHTTVGMCPISNSQALVFTSFAPAEKLELILKTLKFLP